MKLLIIGMMAILLTACGSGSSNTSTPTATTNNMLYGATGKSALVSVKDSTHKEVTTFADADGNYQLDVDKLGIKPPYIAKATFANTSTHFAVSGVNGQLNINSVSTSLLSLAHIGLDLLVLYATFKIELLQWLVIFVEGFRGVVQL